MKRAPAATVQLSKIRMKETLRAALEHDAELRGITINAAIVGRLERSFRDDLDLDNAARLDRLEAAITRIEALLQGLPRK